MKLPTNEFLETFAPAYGDSWEDAIAGMKEHDSRILEDIKATLPIRNMPIVDDEDMEVKDGMHRIAVMVELGYSTIEFNNQFVDDGGDCIELEFSGLVNSSDWEVMLDAVCSLPIGKDRWLNCDFCSMSGNILHMVVDWPMDESELAIKAIVDAASRAGYALVLDSCEMVEWEDED